MQVGAWKKENTVESLKCFNLERVLTTAQFDLDTPDRVGMDQYMEGVHMGNLFIYWLNFA